MREAWDLDAAAEPEGFDLDAAAEFDTAPVAGAWHPAARPAWLWPSELTLAQLLTYYRILIAFSGGKDSLFCLLYLLALGVPPERLELWHHLVDGAEGSTLMDWPVTTAYCRAIARAFGIPLYLSWRVGGFEREMLRENDRTAAARWETPEGTIGSAGGEHGPIDTRRHFPLPIGDLGRRWCSPKLKIEVMDAAIRNQARFGHRRTLVVTGERAEESPKRRQYERFEAHRADLREGQRSAPRHVDHWRPAHGRSEEDVWKLIGFYRVKVHPAYELGFSRVSCATCIFGDENQWATLRRIMPANIARLAGYEADFGKTISLKTDSVKKGGTGRYLTVLDMADRGTPYEMRERDVARAMSITFDEPIFLDTWTRPAGAYRGTPGPT